MKQTFQNVLRVLLGALTMTALMMAVLFAEAHALPAKNPHHASRCR